MTSRPITPKAGAPGTPATEPLHVPQRTPDHDSEARLLEIRRVAEKLGRLEGTGIRPAGAPFPQASPATGYYGIHMLKEPQWNWAIPLYFFIGGAAGSAGVIGTMADWVGDNYELARKARLLAFGGGALSGALLVYDLGRPRRFLNMSHARCAVHPRNAQPELTRRRRIGMCGLRGHGYGSSYDSQLHPGDSECGFFF